MNFQSRKPRIVIQKCHCFLDTFHRHDTRSSVKDLLHRQVCGCMTTLCITWKLNMRSYFVFHTTRFKKMKDSFIFWWLNNWHKLVWTNSKQTGNRPQTIMNLQCGRSAVQSTCTMHVQLEVEHRQENENNYTFSDVTYIQQSYFEWLTTSDNY